MSVLHGLQPIAAILRAGLKNRCIPKRYVSLSSPFRNENETVDASDESAAAKPIDPARDRTKEISYETSIKYLASDAYKETYGTDPVWKTYRRNHKGVFAPRKTRKTCIRSGMISTGSPCPICRDEYLVLDYRNIELLKQFISEYNGEILSYSKTCICQKQHNQLLVAVYKAKEYGLITYDVPFRKYDYSEWYKPESESEETKKALESNA